MIETRGLIKRFGGRPALDGVDLHVPAGTVCGLLGPNGAGKTTVVRILATLLRPDAGTARVAGHDVVRDAARARLRLGLAGQYAAVDEVLTGRTNLVLFGRLYHLSPRSARRRADELLERFGLTAAANRPVRTYSGGMRRRLDLAASLIIAPACLFLDEPTTGIDPGTRLEIWDMIAELVREGTTVLLTTQYLDEADRLADQIVVLDRGRVAAAGPPLELKRAIGGARVDVVVHDPARAGAAAAIMGGDVTVAGTRLSVTSDELVRIATELAAAGIEVDDIAFRRPTLDEVFLHLTAPASRVAA
ncbi:ATP-binding cassette domain-containing protein [Dactylosporangium sp. CS-047395]|uniref:ATP-binding cassette domain-containing protein n=1 Tax=Dactylosporangium sp. CS-047395 TaxID=3239936 RepID=UPI003D8B03C9